MTGQSLKLNIMYSKCKCLAISRKAHTIFRFLGPGQGSNLQGNNKYCNKSKKIRQIFSLTLSSFFLYFCPQFYTCRNNAVYVTDFFKADFRGDVGENLQHTCYMQ